MKATMEYSEVQVKVTDLESGDKIQLWNGIGDFPVRRWYPVKEVVERANKCYVYLEDLVNEAKWWQKKRMVNYMLDMSKDTIFTVLIEHRIPVDKTPETL